MNRLISILLFWTLTFLTACRNSKTASLERASKHFYQDITLLAWNEDTINSFQFALTKDNRFFYTIIKHDSLQELKEFYNGTYKEARRVTGAGHSNIPVFFTFNSYQQAVGNFIRR